jgi:hypothetical protein
MISRMSVRCSNTLVISHPVGVELVFVFFGYLARIHGIAGGVSRSFSLHNIAWMVEVTLA